MPLLLKFSEILTLTVCTTSEFLYLLFNACPHVVSLCEWKSCRLMVNILLTNYCHIQLLTSDCNMHLVQYHVLFIVLLDSLFNSNSNLDKIMLLMPSFSASLTHPNLSSYPP